MPKITNHIANQKITSAATSGNHMPAILALINKVYRRPDYFWAYIDDCLDYGCGKFNKLTDALAEMHIRNLPYDPFNRTEEHNDFVLKLLRAKLADMAICSNVLNVIKSPLARQEALENIKCGIKPDAPVFITVYEGKHKDSRGRRTIRGWQANRPTKNYLKEIRKVFPDAFVCLGNKLIIANAGSKGIRNTKSNAGGTTPE